MGLYEAILEKMAEIDMDLVVNGFFTLAGAVLGSAITVFSRQGKIYMSMSETKISFSQDKGFRTPGPEGGYQYLHPNGDTISIDCRIDIINSSMNTASIRNMGIEFRNGLKTVWGFQFGTETNIIDNSKESLKAVNIYPKELKSYHIFTGGISGIDKTAILKCNYINLIYMNEKGKPKRINVYTGEMSKLERND